MNDLLKIQAVFNERDIGGLRRLYDLVEVHHRGLQALGVDAATYQGIVVPAILNKIPEAIRLQITRGKNHEEWRMDEMLAELLCELELREENSFRSDKNFTREPREKDQRKFGGGPPTANALLAKTWDNLCAYCKGEHAHEHCMNVTSVEERKLLLCKYGRCFICAKKGHISRDCATKIVCNVCKKGCHHVSICVDYVGYNAYQAPRQPRPANNGDYDISPSVNHAHASHASPALHVGLVGRVALQTAQAVITGSKHSRVRVLFDAGSHKSFITTRAVQLAGLQEVRREWIEISTFGQQTRDSGLRGLHEFDVFPLQGGNGIRIEAYEVPSITQIRNEHIENRKAEYPHLQGLWSSDVNRDWEILDVDLLIGADFLWSFQGGRTVRGEPGEPVAVETHLGWVLSGPLNGETWKQGHGPLPSNYHNSLRRLKGQLGRLKSDPTVLNAYDGIIKEQEEVGIVERVTELETTEKIHYLPHHAVIRKDAKTTKVRVVYDASSKEGKRGVSLNDCLHVGPALTPLLYEILIRFREKRVALVGDIEKAFLNIVVNRRDRDCLRFLWVNSVDSEQLEPIVYRFCRVVFGVNCSPFLLNATLQYHLDSFIELDPEFVRIMKKSFYVDDLVSGRRDTQEAGELYDKAKTRLALGGFKLRKWLTNSGELRAKIEQRELRDETDVNKEVESADESYAKETLGAKAGMKNERVLGQSWNCENDVFIFELSEMVSKADDLPVTKRSILKVIAGMYDPLGLVSPVLVSMKALFQELCMGKVGWDEESSGELKTRWMGWLSDLKGAKEIQIPRCVYGVPLGEVTCSLHGFADASRKAYCAVIYFVCELSGAISVTLLTSKTRVSPQKPQTIPRLELMSGRILSTLMSTVKEALEGEVHIASTQLWLDSKTALWWIANNGEWKQFVRHRVNEILKVTKKDEWGHCPGEENPADIGSRGEQASKLKENVLCWNGPPWLTGPRTGWPSTEINETPQSNEEMEKVTVTVACVTRKRGVTDVIDINKFSTFDRLLKVTAWVKRFLFNFVCTRRGVQGRAGMLQRREMYEAERIWIGTAQAELKGSKSYDDLVRQLKLENRDGILKCIGRLENSDLDLESQEPIILPRNHRMTKLIIKECHRRTKHGGVRTTLGELRSRFWVPKGRQVVKKVLRECVTCKRQQGKPFGAPPVAALPEFRVREAAPFSKVGVDFAGPVYVKSTDGEMVKSYIALFTCCVTRAVHLDLVADLTAPTFLRCLRKFTARRGTPSLIVSDNAKTFKASGKILRRMYDKEEVRAHLETNRIDWRFNLERAPWWGGFFERLIGTTKRCLRKVLGNAKLNADEMITVLTELEATMNSRPLTYEYDEVGAEMLTPSHLIYGRRLINLPEEVRDDEEENERGFLKRFRYLAKLRIHFWNRWRKEYLVDLREHHRGNKEGKHDKVSVGELVLVHEDNVKRSNWKLAKVEELIVGKDGQVRGARLKVITKGKPVFMNRAVQKLFPLEVSCVTGGTQGNVGTGENGNQGRVRNTPRRAAALDSCWRTRAMINH